MQIKFLMLYIKIFSVSAIIIVIFNKNSVNESLIIINLKLSKAWKIDIIEIAIGIAIGNIGIFANNLILHIIIFTLILLVQCPMQFFYL